MVSERGGSSDPGDIAGAFTKNPGANKFERRKPAGKPLESEGIELEQDKPIDEIRIDMIDTSPFQCRTNFSENKIKELADNIKGVGLINPIIVRKKSNRYELIAGECRLRAAKLLGWDKIKAIAEDIPDEQAAYKGFFENFSRNNLNEYEQYYFVKMMIYQFGKSQQQISEETGLSKGRVSQLMRLGKLPNDVIEKLIPLDDIYVRHINALRRLQKYDAQLMYQLLDEIIQNKLSGTEAEERCNTLVTESGIVRTPVDGVVKSFHSHISRLINSYKHMPQDRQRKVLDMLNRTQETIENFKKSVNK